MNKDEKPKVNETKYIVECIFCHRRFDILTTKDPIVPFHLSPKGFRCPGADHEGRVVKSII